MTSTKVWRFSETSMDEFINTTCMGKNTPIKDVATETTCSHPNHPGHRHDETSCITLHNGVTVTARFLFDVDLDDFYGDDDVIVRLGVFVRYPAHMRHKADRSDCIEPGEFYKYLIERGRE